MSDKGHDPVIPTMLHLKSSDPIQDNAFISAHCGGLTKREWFSGMAMMGMLANPELTKYMGQNNLEATDYLVPIARNMADAMLAEGEK